MKIQTQARLLLTGIVMAPLLLFLTFMIYRYFIEKEYVSDLPAYEDISALLEEHMSVRDWESLIRSVTHSRIIGEVAVFRDDFLVLYSTIPEFSSGAFTTRENVLFLLDDESQTSTYIFVSWGMEENRAYILVKTIRQVSGPRSHPFFVPALLITIFFISLIVFAIGMSIAIAKTITRSVQVLENATRRIAEGELDLNVDVKGSNEITSLTNSLNKMRNALKEEELRRSRFIMGITHDLKTPLALIKGYAEAIEDGVTEDPVSRSGAAEIIAAKADQLENMINELIDFVKMDSGEWREQLNKVDIAAFLRNAAKIMSMDVGLLHRELTTAIDLPENIFILMDERLVHRVLENLIHNAVRYTPAESLIHLAATQAGSAVEIVVRDNGPGIDKDDLPHVFEMFYRGSSSRREQGMGLGLAVVKWVMDYHGWSISVSSEKGKGTCFVITIPLIAGKR